MPVPHDGRFTISVIDPKRGKINIRIYNILGILVCEWMNIEVNGIVERRVDLQPAPDGIYSVVFEIGNQRTTRKILITR